MTDCSTHLLRRWVAFGVAWLLGIVLCTPAAAVRLDDTRPDVDAWSEVQMLVDGDGTLDLEAALARRGQFAPPATPHANLGVRRTPVWLRVPLEVASHDSGRWLLDLDYPSLDRIDAYLVRDGRVLQAATLGDHLRFDERPMPARSHVLPLAMTPGSAYELVLRVSTSSTMVMPVRLVKLERFHQDDARTQLVQGLAAGIGLCLLMYALAQWAGSREPVYLYYAITGFGTTGFFFAYYGMGSQHLWMHNAWLTNNAAPLMVLLALGGGLLLTERILDVRSLNQRVANAAVALACVAFGTAALFAFDLLPYRAAHLMGTLLGPLPMALAVPYSVIRWRQGDPAAPYLFAGWGVYAVGVAVMASLLRGWVDSNVWTQHAHQASAIFEMLMWLRVLGVRNQQARSLAERAERERERLQAMAHTDALTGLPNRRGLEIELQGALAAANAQHLLAVYVGDLDGFKAVNDRLGHDAGDELLKAVGQRLRAHLRHRDVVARLGGDEFVILARDLPSEATAWQVGRKLVDAFAAPIVVRGQACQVGLTLGYALAPLDGEEGAGLLRRADAAMYAGKQAGKATLRRDGELAAAY